VISWIWTAQVHYDIRYQSEDVYHRFVKGLQITLFVYIGAASGNWNLGIIQDPAHVEGLSGRQMAAYGMSGASRSSSSVLTPRRRGGKLFDDPAGVHRFSSAADWAVSSG
jgi:hypothetical protein